MLLLVAFALLGNGCVSYCDRVADFEKRWAERTAATNEPHLRMAVPYALVDRLLAERIREIDPVELAVGNKLGMIVKLLRFEVKVAAMRARHADDDHVGFGIDLDVRAAGESFVVMHLDARATPRVEGKSVRVAMDADDFERVEPRLGEGAKARIAAMLRTALPSIVSDRLDEAALTELASELGAFLVGEGYRQIRRTLLSRVGKVAELGIALPDIPVRAIRTGSRRGPVEHFALDVLTDRPVARGVAGEVAPTSDKIRARLSGATIAELGNWGIERGILPGRYDDAMKADPNGKLRPRFGWRHGAERPLLVHVLCSDGPCFRLDVAARARAEVKDATLSMDVYDGRIEAIDGSWLVELGVWLKRLGAGPIEVSQKKIASAAVDLFGRRLAIAVASAAIEGDTMTMDLEAHW
jgi:hypothetical protein